MIDRRALTSALLATGVAGRPAAAEPRNKIVPFHFTTGVIWTAVLINGQGPYRFLLHTGQTFFNVSRNLARSLRLPQRNVGDLKGMTSTGELDIDVHVARQLQIDSAILLEKVDMVARDYGAEDVYRGTIPFFAGQPSTFDFENNRLTLFADTAPPADAERFELLRPREGMLSTIPKIRVELDGMPLKLSVNTGSSLGVVLDPATVRRLKLWDRYPQRLTTVGTAPESGRRESRMVRAGSFRMGRFEFERPVVCLGSPEGAPSSKLMEDDGSVGLDVLWRFNFGFDPKRRQAWFKPHANLGEPWSYDRAGYDVDTRDGDDVVVAVLPGGPAEKAGMKVGDRLKWPSPELRLQQFYSQAGAPGSKVELAVEREGKTQPITITLEELI